MDDPEYIVLAALDTPSRETGIYISGGVMAAPTVGAVMEQILPYLGVASNAAEQTVTPQDLTGLTRPEAEAALKSLGLSWLPLGEGDTVTAQLPEPGQTISVNTQLLLYFGTPVPQEQVTVPDFSGMHRQQAADAAANAGLTLRIEGNTDLLPTVTVAEQSVPPDTPVSPGTVIILKFMDTKAAG